jgi:4-diphosphocytidyl-2C-methyl-D-erythritol kinase
MRLLAPAKINLHLRVGRRRADGFHPLLTWMCTVGLFDILTLEAAADPPRAAATPRAAASGDAPSAGRAGELAGPPLLDLRFDCDQPGLPRDEANLVVRIAKAFAAEVFAPAPSSGARVSAEGAVGSRAPGEGGGGGSNSAGAARVEASGMGDADRFAHIGSVPGRTGRGAGAARDAERPVGERDGATSLPREAHGRGGKAEAADAPASYGAAIRIALQKRIPVGAGLGGGSSDGARTLVGLNRLWNAGRAADRLSEFAARFGSDLPFFVAAACSGPSAACSGRGEIVRPVPRPRPKWAVLVLPPFALTTRDVYAKFDDLGLGSDPRVADEPDWTQWAALGSGDLLPRLVNDLEPAAFALSPQLAALRHEVEATVGRVVRMSGSGSSLFTLFDDESADARLAAELIASRHNVSAAAVEMAPALVDDLRLKDELMTAS